MAPTPPGPRAPPRPPWRLAILVAAAVFLASAPLWLNPGWFSHDELQWAARADVAHWRDLPWLAWSPGDDLQWRPLTFNLWLLLSHALREAPRLMHALWVAFGAGLAAWLAVLLCRLGARPGQAAAAALVFALNPYAAYVHGWVATLADLLWVGAGLALAQLVIARRPAGGPGLVAAGFLLTALGLLAKEAALALPALALLCAAAWPCERALRFVAAGSVAAAAAYLAVRLPVLMAPPPDAGYALAPAAAPGNAFDYLLYLSRVSSLEVAGLRRAGTGFIAATLLLWGAVGVGVARARPRLAGVLAAGGVLALAPALPLATTAPQYGYGFSLWLAAGLGLAWPVLGRVARGALLVLALAATWHGVNVMRTLQAVGVRQAVFQPALATALAGRSGALRLYAGARWGFAFRRLSHALPAANGTAPGQVVWVDDPAGADYVVEDDGRLRAAR